MSHDEKRSLSFVTEAEPLEDHPLTRESILARLSREHGQDDLAPDEITVAHVAQHTKRTKRRIRELMAELVDAGMFTVRTLRGGTQAFKPTRAWIDSGSEF